MPQGAIQHFGQKVVGTLYGFCQRKEAVTQNGRKPRVVMPCNLDMFLGMMTKELVETAHLVDGSIEVRYLLCMKCIYIYI